MTGDGQHELLYRATDEAGNAETLKSAIVKIDGTKPTLLVVRVRRRPALRRQPGRPGHVAGGRPDLRHRDTSSARWTARRTPTAPCRRMYELPLGLHELTVTATDKAGNKTTSTVRFFVTTSFRDMQNLLDRFKATGRLSTKAHRQLSNQAGRGPGSPRRPATTSRAVQQLTAFKTLAADAALVTDAEVRDVLIRDADAMIVRLGGTASKAGVKANDGKPVKGAGRLGGDPTRLAPGRQL